MEENIKEFCDIIQFLDDKDLIILHQALLLDQKEQRKYLKKSTNLNGSLYNAYTACVLVSEPIIYVKNEIVNRFIQMKL